MRRMTSVVLGVAATLLLAAPALAQTGGERSPGPVDIKGSPIRDLGHTPLPRPIPPAPTPTPTPTTFTSDNMQLVGFTEQSVRGDAGVLNMSIACQQEFPESRMCTIEEISMSVFIPVAPGFGQAWAQSITERRGAPDTDCNGWMSRYSGHSGTSVDLGDCYGGLVMTSCDRRLAIACCAKTGSTVER